jgi:hypothetical protein
MQSNEEGARNMQENTQKRTSRAQRVHVEGHGTYFLVRGQLYTTPTPKAWSVPCEFAEFNRIVSGPEDQL